MISNMTVLSLWASGPVKFYLPRCVPSVPAATRRAVRFSNAANAASRCFIHSLQKRAMTTYTIEAYGMSTQQRDRRGRF